MVSGAAVVAKTPWAAEAARSAAERPSRTMALLSSASLLSPERKKGDGASGDEESD